MLVNLEGSLPVVFEDVVPFAVQGLLATLVLFHFLNFVKLKQVF